MYDEKVIHAMRLTAHNMFLPQIEDSLMTLRYDPLRFLICPFPLQCECDLNSLKDRTVNKENCLEEDLEKQWLESINAVVHKYKYRTTYQHVKKNLNHILSI